MQGRARSREESRVAIVTGGGRGIGRAIALALARDGLRVAVAARNAGELDETVRRVGSAGGLPAFAVVTDVSDGRQVEALFDQVVGELGEPTVLVNCAGILLESPLIDTTDEAWTEVLTTNLTSVFRCCRAIGRRLLGSGRSGRVVNVTSAFGHVGVSGYSAYSVTKAGIDGLTRTLAVEWAKAGITVNSVSPGHVNTDMPARAFADPRIVALMLKSVPLGRIAEPWEVADLVAYLVSPSAAFITGQSILLDGGYTIR